MIDVKTEKRADNFDSEFVNLPENDQSPFDQASLQDYSITSDSNANSAQSSYSFAIDDSQITNPPIADLELNSIRLSDLSSVTNSDLNADSHIADCPSHSFAENEFQKHNALPTKKRLPIERPQPTHHQRKTAKTLLSIQSTLIIILTKGKRIVRNIR